MPDDFDLAATGEFQEIDEDPQDAGTEPQEPAGGTEPAESRETAAEPATPQAEPWREHARLREGETHEQALERLARDRHEATARSSSNWSEVKALRDELKVLAQKVEPAERLHKLLLERAEAQRKAAEAEAVPDPEVDPDGAVLHRLGRVEGLLERQQKLAQEQAQTAEEKANLERLQAVDANNLNEIRGALGQFGGDKDEEFAADFELVERLTWTDLRRRYPQATQQQLEEGLNYLRLLEGRRAVVAGRTIRDFYRDSAKAFREAGFTVANAQPAPQGNGKPASGTPTPQEIEQAAAAQKRAGGARRVRTAASSVKPPTKIEDMLKLPEAEQAALIEAGKLTEDDIWAALGDDTPYGAGG